VQRVSLDRAISNFPVTKTIKFRLPIKAQYMFCTTSAPQVNTTYYHTNTFAVNTNCRENLYTHTHTHILYDCSHFALK
jgi:hypothetical protein